MPATITIPVSQHAQPGYASGVYTNGRMEMRPVSRYTAAALRLANVPFNRFYEVRNAAYRSERAWPSDATFRGPWAAKAEREYMLRAVAKLRSMSGKAVR